MARNSTNMSFMTSREKEVSDLLARGLSEKEIADRLCISRDTVSNHLRNIREKYGLSKNTEIVLLYISMLNKKKFSLKDVRSQGVSILLVFLNVCQFMDRGPL